jgi:hypothetical protein
MFKWGDKEPVAHTRHWREIAGLRICLLSFAFSTGHPSPRTWKFEGVFYII